MKTLSRFAVILALGVAACTSRAHPKQDADADLAWRPAIDLIVSAFADYPLLALSEGAGHGQLETQDLFAALIRDRRFAPTVRNLVIEFGNARYQAVIDRYVAGEPVYRDDLHHVWEDTTQISGVWSLPMYEHMLADVRSVNESLPPAQRIRVIAGDPPIDWSAVTSPADDDLNDWRDAHFAHVIEREVMRKGEWAVVLIGGAFRGLFPPGGLVVFRVPLFRSEPLGTVRETIGVEVCLNHIANLARARTPRRGPTAINAERWACPSLHAEHLP